MSATKQVLFELATELREICRGQENSDSNNPAKVFFGQETSDSSSEDDSSNDEKDPMDQTMDEFFNLTLDEQDL